MDAPLSRAHHRKRRLRKGTLAVLASAALIASGVAVARLRNRLPSVARAELWTARVTRGDFAMRVQGAGFLRPEAVRWLTAESPGRVELVLVKAGTRVTRDTPVVRLENLDLQLQADQASRDVESARAQALALEHEQARDELSLEQQLGLLKNDLADANRRAEAYEQGAGLVVPRMDSEQERERAATLAEQVALARGKLELLQRLGPRQREVARAQSTQLARVHAVRRQMLDRLLVRAPTEGTVQEVLVEPGQWVLPGASVAKLKVSDRLEAVLRIAADEVGAVAVGQRALIRTGFGRAPDGSIAGHVRRIAPAAQESTVDVEVALEGTLPESARSDQTIDGTIETRVLPNTLSLPRPVALPLGDTVTLYRVDPNTAVATQVRVKLGLVSSDTIQILGGLNEGDQIILSDMSRHAAHDALRLE